MTLAKLFEQRIADVVFDIRFKSAFVDQLLKRLQILHGHTRR